MTLYKYHAAPLCWLTLLVYILLTKDPETAYLAAMGMWGVVEWRGQPMAPRK